MRNVCAGFVQSKPETGFEIPCKIPPPKIEVPFYCYTVIDMKKL